MGLKSADDAGVVRLTDDLALVQTVDFITPPVDDGRVFGSVAAANALSDIYAMGGKPLCALNLVGFPQSRLPQTILQDILQGGQEQLDAADAWLVGGHSVQDEEPKYGLAVSGLVHPQKIWRNQGAQPQDKLLLTKSLGCGILLNAARSKKLTSQEIQPCLQSMQTLNRSTAEILHQFPVHACTDVSGFGLAGHALEMAKASKVSLHLSLSALPLLPKTLDAMKKGITTQATPSNQQFVQPHLQWTTSPPSPLADILFDPQTSGGLLAALPPTHAPQAQEKLQKAGIPAAIIGTAQPLNPEQPHTYLICSPS